MAKRSCDPTSGSIARETYLVGKNGQVVRTRAIPANPNTPAQAAARGIVTSVSGRWRALTDAQRATWTAAAASVMSKPRLGMSGPLSGEQLFCKINNVLATFGQDQVDEAPNPPSFPALAPQSLVITNTGGAIAIKLTCPTNPGQNTVVRGSAPVSAGIARVPRVVILGTCPVPSGGAANITSIYTARYGVPTVGKRIFVAANMFVDGWESPQVTFNALVPAA